MDRLESDMLRIGSRTGSRVSSRAGSRTGSRAGSRVSSRIGFRVSACLATVILTAAVSTACKAGKPVEVPQAVRHVELVGRWDGGKECGAPLPVMRLRDDYTFSLKDFPTDWDGPVPDSKLTRRTLDGEWHGVNDDPGLPPYLVLDFEHRAVFMHFYLERGKLMVNGDVEAGGGDPYHYRCHYERTSADPESGR